MSVRHQVTYESNWDQLLNGGKEIVDAGEFGDVMPSTGKELIILSHRAAEVAEIGEEYKGGQNGGLSGIDFVFGNGTKYNSLEFAYEFEMRE
jgi:hypothetical protein